MSDGPLVHALWRAVTGPKGVYNVVLGTVLGSTVWHSFIGGPIAYMSLPRQQFGHLQSRLFPRFFALQSLSALALLGLYSRRPGGGELVRTFWRHGNKTVWALVVMASSGFANWLFVGPLTTGVMKQRHRKERLEGKSYNEPGVSNEMKALNKRFGTLHGISSLINLVYVAAAVGHAAWIAEYGA
ncbi:hypothetical protein JCM8115_004581 [Rhodotorula mucilaginosa]|nr:hypothetical protein B0A53_04017 [Rhodotorula sp. CCFEE 5036]